LSGFYFLNNKAQSTKIDPITRPDLYVQKYVQNHDFLLRWIFSLKLAYFAKMVDWSAATFLWHCNHKVDLLSDVCTGKLNHALSVINSFEIAERWRHWAFWWGCIQGMCSWLVHWVGKTESGVMCPQTNCKCCLSCPLLLPSTVHEQSGVALDMHENWNPICWRKIQHLYYQNNMSVIQNCPWHLRK
jgi:hypothetical protein